MLSDRFFQAIKSKGLPLHEIAWAAGLTPNQLYKIAAGIDRPNKEDHRIHKLSEFLGLDPVECFEMDGKESL